MKRPLAVAIALACAIASTSAHARPRHHVARIQIQEAVQCVFDNDGHRKCRGEIQRIHGHSKVTAAYDGGAVIGGRPPGCPHAYCGCGAMKYLGLTDKRLWQAWNWTKYYHGPTPVAVWRHHIAIIERMTGPHTAVLRDYNSGRGLSRIHERSIVGAKIVGRTSLAMQ